MTDLRLSIFSPQRRKDAEKTATDQNILPFQVFSAPLRLRGKNRVQGLHGFTLIEICVVVLILAILATIALPSLTNDESLNVSAASRVVLSDLLYAQTRAIATQTNQYVSFSATGSGGYSIYNAEPFATPITNPTSLQPYTVTFGSGGSYDLTSISLAELTLDATTNTVLAFNEMGQPMACVANGTAVSLVNNGSIVLRCGSMTATLTIDKNTGDISVSN